MKILNGNNFSNDAKYKLYRTVHEILHPTISKRNISNYRVVLEEDLLPVHVFYPKKVTNMKKVIIAIPGDGNVSGCYGKYASIYKNMALEAEALIIAIDYFKNTIKYPMSLNKIYKVVSYLYEEFINNGILKENIIFMGDSIGCSILGELLVKLKKKKIEIDKSIWLYPICRNDYSKYEWNEKYLSLNFNLDKKINSYLEKYIPKDKKPSKELLLFSKEELANKNIVVTGDMDLLSEEIKEFSKNIEAEFLNIKYLTHGFLGNDTSEEIKEVYARINDFVKL